MAKVNNAMAPKSKKVETGTATSKAASVAAGASGISSDATPPSVPVVAGDGKTPSTSGSTHSDAAVSSDVPVPPSASSSLPSTSNATHAIAPATSDARRLDVANLALRFDSADSALSDGLIGRESLEVKNDDFEHEKSGGRPKYWVKKLMEAFAQDYLGEPEDTKNNRPEQRAWYARWQKQAHIGVVAIFEMKDPDYLEKCCWFLFDAIIKAHELGVFTMAANNWSASKLKCSKRLAITVTIVEKYAPVRLDILRLWHIEEVAANPEAFIKRKLINCWNNGTRAEKYGKSKKGGKAAVKEVDEEEEAQASADVEAEVSAGVEEGQEPHAASPHWKSKQTLPPRTSGENNTAADGAVEGGDKAKGKGKTNAKKTNTKRARSATPEPRDAQANKKPAVRKRPAGKKAPVAVGTKGRSGGKAASAGAEAEQTI